MKIAVFFFCFFLSVFYIKAQQYKNPELPVEERVQDLLSQMTPEEKFRQLFMIPGDIGDDTTLFNCGIFGFQVNTDGSTEGATAQLLQYTPSGSAFASAEKINALQKFFLEETRLGIPVIPFDEGLHGLIRKGATVFPQAIGLAATFNPDLVYEVAKAIALESASRGIRQILSPVVNVATDVRWGRTEETYGEDPLLVSAMGLAFVSAFETAGIITTPKHFIANVGDGGRDSYPIHVSQRYLREILLPPFETCIRQGGSQSIMTAYNSYDGIPCTANSVLLEKILREEWGFNGFVISDAGATGGANILHHTATDYPSATASAISHGLDVIFQTSIHHTVLFEPPFHDGSISQTVIDSAVARVLRAKFKLGLFENPFVDPDFAAEVNGCDHHKTLSKKAAQESIVLLKNQKKILPLPDTIASVVVIGADAKEARLGGYSGPAEDKVSILKGIKSCVGDKTIVYYASGCSRTETNYVVVPTENLTCTINGKKENGLRGDYYDNIDFKGNAAFSRCDKQIDFRWTLFSPDPEKLGNDFWSVRWSGIITAPETGNFHIGIDGNDGYRLKINGKIVLENIIKRSHDVCMAEFIFEKGKEYFLEIEYFEPNTIAWFSLIWDIGIAFDEDQEIQKASAIAAKSEVAIIVAGIEEGEFRDRAFLNLPGRQEELIHRVAATGTPVIVVLMGGSAITMDRWIQQADAILDVWYPGDQGGYAVADVLFGEYNPGGRLPITFPVFEGQLPLVYNHKPTGRGDDYDNLTGEALFPFGFGLSYTSFSYSLPHPVHQVMTTSDTAKIAITITNTGKVAGDEVVQLYIHDPLATVVRPVKELKDFRRIYLEAGESREVEFFIPPEKLILYDQNLKKTVEPGLFRIFIGASSKDIRQQAEVIVNAKD
ncbi:MAG: glycoside hydrolase family 3 N-terminal domain-containing protein [Bacteroidales bacterium]|nr:glycoside hydrolase family 3 N-terminal domain-containing protein [Bacteroidales bacterium]MDY0286207.1 glycoside hydrolase family 3 N-terminal domain-containing protein [Bacteroidales bacterium]HPE87799.1 glycoside hydrolase family 3 N-terminal domain-containing protein [Bacteroidales bacterium]